MTSPQPDVNLYVSTPNLQKTSCWTHCSSVKDLVYCMWRQGNITTQSYWTTYLCDYHYDYMVAYDPTKPQIK